MLHAVTHHNIRDYAAQMEQHYRMRHKVFVEHLGWTDLKRDDAREIDQFDTKEAIHLLFLDDDNEETVLGGARLLPTTQPHLLSDIFPHLATRHPVPRQKDIYEITRFYVDPAIQDKSACVPVSQKLMCGIQEYCLDQTITSLSAVVEPYWLPRLKRFGWNPEPLGLPTRYKNIPIIGLLMDISEKALAGTRRGLLSGQSVMYH